MKLELVPRLGFHDFRLLQISFGQLISFNHFYFNLENVVF